MHGNVVVSILFVRSEDVQFLLLKLCGEVLREIAEIFAYFLVLMVERFDNIIVGLWINQVTRSRAISRLLLCRGELQWWNEAGPPKHTAWRLDQLRSG